MYIYKYIYDHVLSHWCIRMNKSDLNAREGQDQY